MKNDTNDVKRIISSDAEIKKVLTDGKLSRRDFLTFAGALGLSGVMGSSLWSKRALAASEPVRGGHLIAGLNDANTVDSLDSTQYNATTMIVVSRSFRDSIVDVGVDGSAQPNLAESWEASPDAKEWRFKIRQGVEFSNGKSLTVEDVIASLQAHLGEESKSAAKGVFAGISDVKADGNTMVVTLKDANADLPYLFTDYHFSVVPSKDGKADLMSTHGTGCYLLKEFEPGVKTVLEKNPNAWQGDQLGFFDSAEIIAILDDAARESALISGAAEVINRPVLKTLARLKRVKGINIVDVPSNLAYTHPMRTNIAPFDNNDFRMALKLSTPRQEFIDKILYGYGSMGNDQPLGPKFASYDANLKVEYDLDKARDHLKKAGMEGAKFEMSAADTAYGGALDAAQLFQQHWEKIGLKPTIVREAKDGYWSNVWNKKPFCACYWGARPVEDMILSIAYLSDSPWNDTVINIKRVDELVVKARGELDQNKRKEMYSEVQHLISGEGGTIIPAFGNDVAAASDKIGYGEIGGGWEMDGGHFVKRWWKKA